MGSERPGLAGEAASVAAACPALVTRIAGTSGVAIATAVTGTAKQAEKGTREGLDIADILVTAAASPPVVTPIRAPQMSCQTPSKRSNTDQSSQLLNRQQ